MAARPKQRRNSERRNREDEVMEAAVAVFSEKGYSAASLQDVADTVGLLKGSLYHYISSKESLLFRIFDEAHAQALILMTEVDELQLPPDRKLRDYVERLSLWYLGNRQRASLYFTEWRYLTGEYETSVRAQRREFEMYVRTILIDAQEAGLTRDDLDPRVTSSYILSAVNSVPIWYRPGGPLKPEELARQVAELSYQAAFGRSKARKLRAS